MNLTYASVMRHHVLLQVTSREEVTQRGVTGMRFGGVGGLGGPVSNACLPPDTWTCGPTNLSMAHPPPHTLQEDEVEAFAFVQAANRDTWNALHPPSTAQAGPAPGPGPAPLLPPTGSGSGSGSGRREDLPPAGAGDPCGRRGSTSPRCRRYAFWGVRGPGRV